MLRDYQKRGVETREAVEVFVCTRCNIEYAADGFGLDKGTRRTQCRKCAADRAKEWREKYPDRAKAARRAHYYNNRERRSELNKTWRKNNQESIKKKKADYYQATKERDRERKNAYMREYEKRRRKEDICFSINDRMSRAIRGCLDGNVSKQGRKWQTLVGYTVEELKEHLEKQFKKGMGWHNRHLWHIDHIIPISSFDIKTNDSEDFKAAWSLTNLRPLWAKENIAKKNRRENLL